MNQSILLIDTLKRYLRHQRITYKELAKKLGQSEANIKRIFSEQSISLRGLEQMCAAAGIELLELAKMSLTQRVDAEYFTKTQEEDLAKDPKLFAFAYLILHERSPSYILSKYSFTQLEARRYLLRLDKIGIIRLHEKDRVEILTSKNVRWQEEGPLNLLYKEEIKKEFMNSSFTRTQERLRLLNARFSEHSLQMLSRRLDRLISEFVSLAELDQLGGGEKAQSIWLVLAYRPWKFSVLTRYLRKKME